MFWARIDQDDPTRKQRLTDHVNGVTRRCQNTALPGVAKTGELAGAMHDLGKFTSEWQDYLLANSHSTKKVPHSPHGALYIFQTIEKIQRKQANIDDPVLNTVKDVLYYIISAHHGLFDALTLNGTLVIKDRTENIDGQRTSEIQAALKQYFEVEDHLLDQSSYEQLVRNCIDEWQLVYPDLDDVDLKYSRLFSLSLLTRMLLSQLMSADWNDAAAFHSRGEQAWQQIVETIDWQMFDDHLQEYVSAFDQSTPINKIRSQIAQECRDSAKKSPGIYKLDVPTGGGKTLAVMQYALKHAQLYNKKHIIYVAPYKSIIDQTAQVYREALLDEDVSNRQLLILEHHGDIVRPARDAQDHEIFDHVISTWQSPIIITTLVQLLNTIFSDNKAALTRMHQLAESIIIIDEFQSTPLRILTPFALALNFLARYMGTTVVLATATQLPLDQEIESAKSFYKMGKLDYAPALNLVNDYGDASVFDRVDLIDLCKNKKWSLDYLASRVISEYSGKKSGLVILNTRKSAERLYNEIVERGSNQINSNDLYLLSNNMIPEHRRQVIDEIKHRLKKKDQILLISTSLIEAGVDLSFHFVFRSLTGLDSIIQAAGRCNRHGENVNENGETEKGKLFIVNPHQDWESLSRLEDINLAANVMEPILRNFKKRPEQYGYDLRSSQAIEQYFKKYLSKITEKTHYQFTTHGVEVSLYNLLTKNDVGRRRYGSQHSEPTHHVLTQAFATAGRAFKAIDDQSHRILVPWGKGKAIINQLLELEGAPLDYDLVTDAERYSVGVFQHDLIKLKDMDALVSVYEDRILILKEGFYDEKIGLVTEEKAGDAFIL
ncbi:MAG: CRISPR-associated helicase Cas3' [Fastidiosipilaceae bacterium]|jgi:CRISPR-associated endonuclease/helicase Cas3|nr:CRISPR-associated helicase Cas3' [Clostridiaceae bacterium]